MEYKLGRYKFKQCRHSGYSRARMFICMAEGVCLSVGHIVKLSSRRVCDTCEFFEPIDNLEFFVGLPKEKKSQEEYNKRRR